MACWLPRRAAGCGSNASSTTWPGARRKTGGELCEKAHAAGQQGHAATSRKNRARVPSDPLKVVGIDDWAWRRNQRYASIICDLEKRRVVSLLPDREPATAQVWLAGHPTIAIVARDRGGGYGEAATKALPHAVQVADRWHLMENASRAFP